MLEYLQQFVSNYCDSCSLLCLFCPKSWQIFMSAVQFQCQMPFYCAFIDARLSSVWFAYSVTVNATDESQIGCHYQMTAVRMSPFMFHLSSIHKCISNVQTLRVWTTATANTELTTLFNNKMLRLFYYFWVHFSVTHKNLFWSEMFCIFMTRISIFCSGFCNTFSQYQDLFGLLLII